MANYDDTATVSGSIVRVNDGADSVPLKNWLVTLPASLDGYSQVDIVSTGKNILPMVNYDGGVYNPDIDRQLNLTVSETQFTKNGNVYSVTTSATWKTFTVLFPIISGVTYYEKWTLSIESGQQGSTRAYLDEDFKVLARYNNNSSDPITTNGVMSPPTGAKYLAITFTNRGTAVQTLNITEPMIEIGSSASAWEEYNGTTYTVNLGRTIHGGTPDVVNGVGIDAYHAPVTFDGSSDEVWKAHGTLSNVFYIDYPFTNAYANNSESGFILSSWGEQKKYSSVGQLTNGGFCYAEIRRLLIKNTDYIDVEDFKTWLSNNPITMVYKLATPEDFTFTGQEVPTRLGNNTMWSEQGDTELTYYKSGYGFTSVTIHKETPSGEPVVETAKFHRIVYGGTADVIRGTCEPKNLADENMRQDGNNRVILAENLYLKSGTYTISLDIETPKNFYYKPHNVGSWTNIGGYNKKVVTFTISEDNNYDFSYYISTGVSISEISNLMIEVGSSASEYVPHFEPFTFPPISMETDEGENTLFANEGDSAITYRKETD